MPVSRREDEEDLNIPAVAGDDLENIEDHGLPPSLTDPFTKIYLIIFNQQYDIYN